MYLRIFSFLVVTTSNLSVNYNNNDEKTKTIKYVFKHNMTYYISNDNKKLQIFGLKQHSRTIIKPSFFVVVSKQLSRLQKFETNDTYKTIKFEFHKIEVQNVWESLQSELKVIYAIEAVFRPGTFTTVWSHSYIKNVNTDLYDSEGFSRNQALINYNFIWNHSQ